MFEKIHGEPSKSDSTNSDPINNDPINNDRRPPGTGQSTANRRLPGTGGPGRSPPITQSTTNRRSPARQYSAAHPLTGHRTTDRHSPVGRYAAVPTLTSHRTADRPSGAIVDRHTSAGESYIPIGGRLLPSPTSSLLRSPGGSYYKPVRRLSDRPPTPYHGYTPGGY